MPPQILAALIKKKTNLQVHLLQQEEHVPVWEVFLWLWLFLSSSKTRNLQH